MCPETPHHPLGPVGPSHGFPAGSLGMAWGETVEASFGVPPSVLTLRVNRNIINHYLGVRKLEIIKTQCPVLGLGAGPPVIRPALHCSPGLSRPRLRPRRLPRGPGCPQGPTPQGIQLVRPRGPRTHTWAPPGRRPHHQPWTPGDEGGHGEGLRGWQGGQGACACCPLSASRVGAGLRAVPTACLPPRDS